MVADDRLKLVISEPQCLGVGEWEPVGLANGVR